MSPDVHFSDLAEVRKLQILKATSNATSDSLRVNTRRKLHCKPEAIEATTNRVNELSMDILTRDVLFGT